MTTLEILGKVLCVWILLAIHVFFLQAYEKNFLGVVKVQKQHEKKKRDAFRKLVESALGVSYIMIVFQQVSAV